MATLLPKMEAAMLEALVEPANDTPNSVSEEQFSLTDLFVHASRELAQSDARLYRSVDRHLRRTREILGRAAAEPDGFSPHSPSPPIALLLGAPSFERQTRRSLEMLCKQHGVRGYSRMSKATMILHLKQAGVAEPSVPMEALSKSELLTLLRDVLSSSGHNA
ncbi:MAG: hypothetical protein ACKN89_10740 [Cyanobium sp.]